MNYVVWLFITFATCSDTINDCAFPDSAVWRMHSTKLEFQNPEACIKERDKTRAVLAQMHNIRINSVECELVVK